MASLPSGRLAFLYDSFGRLIRENNQALDKTILYCYNDIGNITSVETFDYTTGNVTPGTGTIQNYTYDTTYPDRLKNFNGKGIVYNTLHCPTNYDGKSWTWTKGKLTRVRRGSANQPGSEYKDCTFTYDGYGRRINKHYIYDPNPAVAGDGNYYYDINYNYDESGRLIREFCTTHYDDGTDSTREFIFLYDESGIIGTMYSLNGAVAQPYYYRRNVQGDVIAIYDKYGSRKAEYAYDAFGNCTVLYAGLADLANNNPIRYRGYYYDKETNLYYLNSRYYNPEWRRFISPDSTEYIDPETPNGLNLYAYCYNDPVNYVDPSGHFVLSSFLIGLGISAAIGAGIGAASYVVSQGINYAITGDWEWSWGGFAGSIVGGAVGGMVSYVIPYIGVNGAVAGAFCTGATTNAGTMIGQNITNNANYSFMDILLSSTISGGFSALSVGIMSRIRISGFNSGRGSYSAISNQIFTKFRNQTIAKITMRTFGKMLAVEAYNGIASLLFENTYNLSNINSWVLSWY